YFDANTEWKEKTIKAYSGCIERFISWCATENIYTVEEINKEHVISFKSCMDEEQLASMTKQKIITALGSMFSFIMNVKEWINKNPFKGMNYKKVSVEKPKEEVTLAQFKMMIEQPKVIKDAQNYWANVLMFYTGMRVSELQQITKNDYVEIEGIKCISINTYEEGKSTKTESSKRNIPICDALLALNVWEEKPVMKNGLNSIMDKISKAYKVIGLKRSSHCYRHSMSNRLRDTDTDDSTRAFILGHAAHGITDRVYITRLPLVKMQKALNDAN
ncbi:tyrosine-type recombinase/integrase, partial [Salmonella enterica subsp. houtenae]|nr:tyrosine-type recombinase/integrase [Salmonella enterica subsp. houtenae]